MQFENTTRYLGQFTHINMYLCNAFYALILLPKYLVSKMLYLDDIIIIPNLDQYLFRRLKCSSPNIIISSQETNPRTDVLNL